MITLYINTRRLFICDKEKPLIKHPTPPELGLRAHALSIFNTIAHRPHLTLAPPKKFQLKQGVETGNQRST